MSRPSSKANNLNESWCTRKCSRRSLIDFMEMYRSPKVYLTQSLPLRTLLSLVAPMAQFAYLTLKNRRYLYWVTRKSKAAQWHVLISKGSAQRKTFISFRVTWRAKLLSIKLRACLSKENSSSAKTAKIHFLKLKTLSLATSDQDIARRLMTCIAPRFARLNS